MYFSAEASVWGIAAALLVLAAIAGVYIVRGDRERSIVAASCVLILAPSLAGWQLAVPVFGAGLLLWANLAHQPWRQVFALRWSLPAAAASITVVAGVIVFHLASSLWFLPNAGFGWVVVPGAQYGTGMVWAIVIGAAAVNAMFEEQLWRVALPRLFPGRRWLIFQWALVSVCFGLSHLHGLPTGIVGMIFAGVFGFAMCFIRHLSGGSLMWAVPVHFLADVILIGALYGLI